jgi:ATP-dependent Clp endopeptidase proteolytic subunit ClpP
MKSPDTPPTNPLLDAAEVEATSAEAEASRALADLRRAEAREAELRVAKLDLELAKARRTETAELAKDDNNHVYRFTGGVSTASVQACVTKLSEWHRTAPGCPITLVISSPGGSVFDGMVLVDFLGTLSAAGHHITTVCAGMAASMGGIILQAGDTRVCGPESWVLIHRVSTTAGGSTYQLEDEVELLKRLEERVIRLFVRKSGGKLTAARIKKNWQRKDWWLSSDEALALGVVDEVR